WRREALGRSLRDSVRASPSGARAREQLPAGMACGRRLVRPRLRPLDGGHGGGDAGLVRQRRPAAEILLLGLFGGWRWIRGRRRRGRGRGLVTAAQLARTG